MKRLALLALLAATCSPFSSDNPSWVAGDACGAPTATHGLAGVIVWNAAFHRADPPPTVTWVCNCEAPIAVNVIARACEQNLITADGVRVAWRGNFSESKFAESLALWLERFGGATDYDDAGVRVANAMLHTAGL